MAPLGVVAALLLAALMLAMPVGPAAGADGTGGPLASAAKKKCKKKGASAAKKKCKKKRGGGFYLEGRYAGTYSNNNVNLFFNVLGGRVYTGPFDAFYLDATCYNSDPEYTGPNQVYTDATAYEPVSATIGPSGSFAGSGVYNTGFTSQPWTLSGQISGGSITGTFTSSYKNTYDDPCSGSTSFTAQWYGAYTL